MHSLCHSVLCLHAIENVVMRKSDYINYCSVLPLWAMYSAYMGLDAMVKGDKDVTDFTKMTIFNGKHYMYCIRMIRCDNLYTLRH